MARRTVYILLLLVTAISCKSKAEQEYQLERAYSYRVLVQAGGTGGTQYQLRRKSWRFSQFQADKVPENTAMFAYRILREGDPFAPPPYRNDTIEVAVTPPQADHLFALAKAYFETLDLTDVDTISQRVEQIQTDDIAGHIQLTVKGQEVTAVVKSLHATSVSRQSAAFFLVHEEFSQLFPHEPSE